MNKILIAVLDPLRKQLNQRLAVDLKSLSFFRVFLGGTLLMDLWIRIQDLESLYSGNGVLPLEALAQLPHLPWEWWLSINVLSDSVAWQTFCFCAGMLCAFLLMIGWKTRWIAPCMLILLHSIQARNPWVNYAADKLLFLLLLWACFVPLDRYWSVSRSGVSSRIPPLQLSSFGAWGLMLLPCVMYLFSVLRKSGDTWLDGSALRYVLEIDQFASPLGIWLKSVPDFVLRFLTWCALGIEVISPLLLLSKNVRFRWLGICLLILFQFSLWLTMDLGIFPWVSTLAILPHIPSGFWRSNKQKVDGPSLVSLTSAPKGGQRWVGWLLVFMLLWNFLMTWNYPDSVKAQLPRWLSNGISLLRMDQYWGMFSPNPMTLDGWYVIAAELEDGRVIDFLEPEREDLWSKPAQVLQTYPSDRWKEYMMRIFDYPSQSKLWQGVISYFQSQWRSQYLEDVQVKSVTVYYMIEKTTALGVLPVEKEQLWPATDDNP